MSRSSCLLLKNLGLVSSKEKQVRMLNSFLYGAGKAYHIKEITKGSYFYPKEDGQGEISTIARPLKDGELVREALVSSLTSLLNLISLLRLNGYFWTGYGDRVASCAVSSHDETDTSNLRKCCFAQPL
jgi:hypothetical protein